jgi:hypothetical protein
MMAPPTAVMLRLDRSIHGRRHTQRLAAEWALLSSRRATAGRGATAGTKAGMGAKVWLVAEPRAATRCPPASLQAAVMPRLDRSIHGRRHTQRLAAEWALLSSRRATVERGATAGTKAGTGGEGVAVAEPCAATRCPPASHQPPSCSDLIGASMRLPAQRLAAEWALRSSRRATAGRGRWRERGQDGRGEGSLACENVSRHTRPHPSKPPSCPDLIGASTPAVLPSAWPQNGPSGQAGGRRRDGGDGGERRKKAARNTFHATCSAQGGSGAGARERPARAPEKAPRPVSSGASGR